MLGNYTFEIKQRNNHYIVTGEVLDKIADAYKTALDVK